jgi:hypothetical protein
MTDSDARDHDVLISRDPLTDLCAAIARPADQSRSARSTARTSSPLPLDIGTLLLLGKAGQQRVRPSTYRARPVAVVDRP